MQRLIFIVLLVLLAGGTRAQDSLSRTDEISYGFYLSGNWAGLVDYGERSLKEKEDFFYLRFRLGIAYYELKQFRSALVHFEKAYAMNDKDEVLKEYLYYSYIYTEQYPQALRLSRHFSPQSTEPPAVHLIHAEYGMKVSTNDSFYKPMHYFQAGAGFRVMKLMTGYTSFTQISQQTYYGNLSQQQYFLQLQVPLKRSWMVMPSFHYLSYTYSNVPVTQVVVAQPPPAPGGPPPTTQPYATSYTNNYDGSAYVASLMLSKSCRDFVFTFGGAYSTLNKGTQHQETINATWYPLHQNRLALSAGVTLLSNDTEFTFHPVLSGGALYHATPRLALSASFTRFNARSFSEQNGYMVNNAVDITHRRITGGIEWNCYRNVSLYLNYLQESKTELISGKDYQYNMGIIGLKLIF